MLTLLERTRQDSTSFVKGWENGWNSHDLDLIMAHYREDIVFRSRKALALTGQGELRGRLALRAYWKAALDVQPELRFQVQDVFEGHDMLVISYLNHKGVLAVETLYFGADGLMFQAAACHRSTV